jgi:hypothetical protein
MKRFLSTVLLSQAALVAQQLVLLPLQIHIWGHDLVAIWLAQLALAAIVGVSDLGLRNAGFALVAANDVEGRFRSLWSVIRAHMFVAALAMMVLGLATFHARLRPEDVAFVVLLTIGATLEHFLGQRISLIEARGRIALAEAAFLIMTAPRFVLGGVMLYFFHAGPLALAVLWLVTAVVGLVFQEVTAGIGKVAPFFGKWRFTGLKSVYSDASWAASTTIVSWTQIQLPVVALSAFAPSAIVSSFVALRSLFGLTRLVLIQVSRPVSVKYGERSRAGDADGAKAQLLLIAAGIAWLAAGAGLAVFSERQLFTGPVFDLPRNQMVLMLTLTLALSSMFAIHNIFTLSMARSGGITLSGAANYIYSIGMVAACGAAFLTKSVPILFFGAAACDVILLALIVRLFVSGAPGEATRRGLRTFMGAMGMWVAAVGGGWAIIAATGRALPDLISVAVTAAIAFVVWLALGAVVARANWAQWRSLRKSTVLASV